MEAIVRFRMETPLFLEQISLASMWWMDFLDKNSSLLKLLWAMEEVHHLSGSCDDGQKLDLGCILLREPMNPLVYQSLDVREKSKIA